MLNEIIGLGNIIPPVMRPMPQNVERTARFSKNKHNSSAHIICKMQDLGIEPTYNPFPGYDYPVKEILNMFSENKLK